VGKRGEEGRERGTEISDSSWLLAKQSRARQAAENKAPESERELDATKARARLGRVVFIVLHRFARQELQRSSISPVLGR
jgi:hypothetical protein